MERVGRGGRVEVMVFASLAKAARGVSCPDASPPSNYQQRLDFYTHKYGIIYHSPDNSGTLRYQSF